MLGVRRRSPEPHLKSYSAYLTVSPRDVFGDYEEVMEERNGETRPGADSDRYADSAICGERAAEA
jgi:hypothetical protein